MFFGQNIISNGLRKLTLNIQVNNINKYILLFFSLCEDFISLSKKIFPDSEINSAIEINKNNCKRLCTVLAEHVTLELVIKLKNKFIIIIDETTGVSTHKAFAILVKYYDHEEFVIKTEMLDLINVYESEYKCSSGETLFSSILNCLRKHDIPMENLIGFAADGAANIIAYQADLKGFLPGINIFKCVAHSIHLCSSKAVKTFPRSCEDLVRNVYNFFLIKRKENMNLTSSKLFVTYNLIKYYTQV